MANRDGRKVVLVVGAQMGKSEALLDIIGHQFDQRPSPVISVGPNLQYITDEWEPRLMEMLEGVPSLRARLLTGKRMKKTLKTISGQRLKLAHAGSSTALKGMSASLAISDEADEFLENVKGQGDPFTLIDHRGNAFADFTHAVVSTPSSGPREVVMDPESGLEFWGVQDGSDLESPIWAMWQSGTRYHWTWKCPHCGDRFVPRFSCLGDVDPKRLSPSQAMRHGHLICPNNGCIITEDHKDGMNEGGLYVAPGQSVDADGVVTGGPPESTTVSFWVSGLASPFVTWGQRLAEYVEAFHAGDQEALQTAMNAGFGELWSPTGGDAPEWEEVKKLALPYRDGDVPEGVVFLTAGVDVQKNRLVYTVRGWGARQESWLITAGELWGPTDEHDVWVDLEDLLASTFGGMHIARTFVDAGFRPGKKDAVPEHRVYELARRNSRRVYATKGFDTRPTPLSVNRIEVNANGGRAKYGLDLVRLSTDFFKSWVHERIRWPEDQPGGWHLHENVTDEYCRQIVSEARVRKPKSSGFQWIVTYRENHGLDTEALAYAAAYMLGVQRLRDNARRPAMAPAPASPQQEESEPQQERPSKPPPRRSGWLSEKGSGWL